MTRKIAFITYSENPQITQDDVLLAQALSNLGAEAVGLPWEQANVDYQVYDAMIIRSCWNYHLFPRQFENWIRGLKSQRVKLFNSPETVCWNMNKRYLQTLQSWGVVIPETMWVQRGMNFSLAQIMQYRRWHQCVVKPAVSATAHNTFRITPENTTVIESKLKKLVADQDFLIQEFMPEVVDDGEWSFLFFDRKFSHAVVKRSKPEDFRVQNDFGGTASRQQPSASLLSQVNDLVELISAKINDPLLYARVDGLVRNNQFMLMELELIEPNLFLGFNEQAPVILAEALLNSMNS